MLYPGADRQNSATGCPDFPATEPREGGGACISASHRLGFTGLGVKRRFVNRAREKREINACFPRFY